jgi:hypothetical protein
MPGSDASQFTRFKKANAVQKGDTQATDSKSVNRLTQYTPHLTAASSTTEFLSTLTAKTTTPITRDPIKFQSAFGKSTIPHPNASNNF